MSKIANVSFKYNKLNDLSTTKRYYLTWFLNIIINKLINFINHVHIKESELSNES